MTHPAVEPVEIDLGPLAAADRVQGAERKGTVVVYPGEPVSPELTRVVWDDTGYPVQVPRASLIRIPTAEADAEDLRSLQLIVNAAKGLRPCYATTADLGRVESLIRRFRGRPAAAPEGR